MPDDMGTGVEARHAGIPAVPGKGAIGGLLAIFDWAGRIFLSALVGRELASRTSRFADCTRIVFGGALCGFAVATVSWGVLSALDRIRYDTPPLLVWGGVIGGGLSIILWILAESLKNPERPRGMPKLDHQLGRTLVDLRQRARLSQEELASRANLFPPYISLLEQGLKSPTVRVIFVLAGVYGVSASEILRQVEELAAREGDSVPRAPQMEKQPRSG